jgi:hypothetical protein
MVFTQRAPNCVFSFTLHGGLFGGRAPQRRFPITIEQLSGPYAEPKKQLPGGALDSRGPFRQNARMGTSFPWNGPSVATRVRRSLEKP